MPPAQLAEFEKASPTFGGSFAYGFDLRVLAGRQREPEFALAAKGAPPIVVLGTTRDPATPYRWAQSLRRAARRPGRWSPATATATPAFQQGNACVNGAVERYLVGGTVPGDGPDLLKPCG